MFGNQTLLCQMVLPVRSCAAAIRPDRERAWRARSAAASRGPATKDRCQLGCFAEFRTIQADLPVSRWQPDAAVNRRSVRVEDGRCRLRKITGKWLIGQRKLPLRALHLSVAGASDPRETYRSLRVSIPGRMACRLALRRCASKEAEPLSHARMVLR